MKIMIIGFIILCCTFYGFFFVKEIYQNVRKEGSIKNPTTGYFLEMDIWIPDFNICLEFQVCILSHNSTLLFFLLLF